MDDRRGVQDEPDMLEDVYHEVSRLPNAIVSNDPPTQRDVLYGILRGTYVPTADCLNEFYEEVVHDLTLGKLQRHWEYEMKEESMRLLLRRNRIVIRDEDKVSSLDDNLYWGVHKHFLDFLTVVPIEMGLDAIIPNQEVDHNYEFQLELKKWRIRWQATRAHLGFVPTGRMMYVGTAEGQQVWLAMAPKSFFGERSPAKVYEDDNDKGVMSSSRYRRCVLMLTFMLSRIAFAHIYSIDDYPQNIDEDGWEHSTNLL
jgi:hypothetical protein